MQAIDLTIRPIENGDVTEVVGLWHDAGVSRPRSDPKKDIAFARASPHGAVLVGGVEGRVASTIMGGEDGHRGWVYYVATLPELQRRGLARRMMDAAETWLKARGIWKLPLLIRDDNAAAQGFYERLGYRDTKTVCFQKVIAD